MNKRLIFKYGYLFAVTLMIALSAAAIFMRFSPEALAETVKSEYYYDVTTEADLDIPVSEMGSQSITVSCMGVELIESIDYEITAVTSDSFTLTLNSMFLKNYSDHASITLKISTAAAADFEVTIYYGVQNIEVKSIHAYVKQGAVEKTYDKTAALPEGAIDKLQFYINADKNALIKLTNVTAEYASVFSGRQSIRVLTYQAPSNYILPPDLKITVEDGENIRITKRAITLRQPAQVQLEKIYDGTDTAYFEQTPIFDGILEGDSPLTYQAAYGSKDAGISPITVSYILNDSVNYTAPNEQVFINGVVKPCPAKVVVDNAEKVYLTADPLFTYRVFRQITSGSGTEEIEGLYLGDTLLVKDGFAAVSRPAGEDAVQDGYALTANLYHNNYALSFISAKLTILPAEIFNITCPNVITLPYRNSDEFLQEDLQEGLQDCTLIAYTQSSQANVTVAIDEAKYQAKTGSTLLKVTKFSLSGEKSGNYSISPRLHQIGFSLAAEFTRLSLTVKQHAQIQPSKIYDGNNLAVVTSQPIVEGVLSGDTVTVIVRANYSSANVNAESIYVEYFSSHAGYVIGGAFEITKDVKISPRPLTVRAISAEKILGQSDPKLEYTAIGMISKDTLSGHLSRQEGEAVGQYQILLGTLGNPNYDITFESADFYIRANTAKGCAAFTSFDDTLGTGLLLLSASVLLVGVKRKSIPS